MKCLVAGDDDAICQRVCNLLVREGFDCPTTAVVPLEVAGDRAGRLNPPLVILALGSDHERSLLALREVCQASSKCTVVIGPADNAKLILATMHEGADEYLNENLLETELSGAVTRFKARQGGSATEQDVPGRVISVLACSGGSGSSTIAANISAGLAKKQGTCGLIDLRLSVGDLAPLLDMRPNYNLANLAENIDRVDEEMFDQLFTLHPSGIRLLAAPTTQLQASRVTERVVRQAISMARRRFPYVVIDVDHSQRPEQIEALWQSEVIVIVLRLDYLSIRNTRRTMEHLKQLGLSLDHVTLVVNRYGEHKQLSHTQAEESLGRKISHFIPNDPSRINGAMNAGSPVLLQRPFAKVSKRLALLADSVNGLHHAPKVKRGFFK